MCRLDMSPLMCMEQSLSTNQGLMIFLRSCSCTGARLVGYRNPVHFETGFTITVNMMYSFPWHIMFIIWWPWGNNRTVGWFGSRDFGNPSVIRLRPFISWPNGSFNTWLWIWTTLCFGFKFQVWAGRWSLRWLWPHPFRFDESISWINLFVLESPSIGPGGLILGFVSIPITITGTWPWRFPFGRIPSGHIFQVLFIFGHRWWVWTVSCNVAYNSTIETCLSFQDNAIWTWSWSLWSLRITVGNLFLLTRVPTSSSAFVRLSYKLFGFVLFNCGKIRF